MSLCCEYSVFFFLAKNYLTLLSMPTVTQWNTKLNTMLVWLFTTCKRRHIWAAVYRHSTRRTLCRNVEVCAGMCACVWTLYKCLECTSDQRAAMNAFNVLWWDTTELRHRQNGHSVRKSNANTGFVGTAVIWFVDASQIFRWMRRKSLVCSFHNEDCQRIYHILSRFFFLPLFIL